MGIKVFFALVVISRLTIGQGRYENKYFQLLIYSLEFPKNKKRKEKCVGRSQSRIHGGNCNNKAYGVTDGQPAHEMLTSLQDY